MNVEKKNEVARDSLEKAKLYFKEENYGRAFAHYLVVFELCPDQKAENEKDFVYALNEWGLILEERTQFEHIYKCYEQALHYFPASIEILNSFGIQLLRLEQNNAALKYFNMAYTLDKKFLPSEKNLYITKINMLPRWHFRMLNDRVRNEAYRKALQLNISRKFCRVIDIGAGCGLLSLFSSKCSEVQSVTAVEESPVLSDIAVNIFRENGMNNVTLLNKASTELNGNLCGFHNLLVTEIFDSALFGEHALETLIHAWENLLETSSRVIPYSAKVYVTGINSNNIYRKHRYLENYTFLSHDNICLTQAVKEPYEAENLESKNVKFVTTTEDVISVNFNDVSQLKNFYTNPLSIPPLKLKVLEDSEIQAFAIWFDLYVDDFNMLTTDPKKKNVICWEQAVIYIDHPYLVKKEEEVQIQLTCIRDKLHLEVINQTVTCNTCFKISQDVILFLNDESLVQKIFVVSEHFSRSDYMILDLSPFPIFGILMAKRGCKVHCIINKDKDLEYLNYLCHINGIHDNLSVLSEDAFNSLFKMVNIYDIIFMDAVYPNGTVNEKYVGKYSAFRQLLKQDGIILPEKILLMVQIIDSDYVDSCSKVNDKNAFGFKIAEQMNEYAVPELWELDYISLPHRGLHDPIEIWEMFRDDEDPHETEFNIYVNKCGKASGVLYWFKFYFTDGFQIETNFSSYYKSACFVFSNPVELKENDVFKLTVKQHRGFLKVDTSY